MNELTDHEHRLLTLVYKMTGGQSFVPINKQDLFRESERIGLFTMTNDEYLEWCEKEVDPILLAKKS